MYVCMYVCVCVCMHKLAAKFIFNVLSYQYLCVSDCGRSL